MNNRMFLLSIVAAIIFAVGFLTGILGNIIVASLSGVWVPWLLNRHNMDPALSGAVILATLTDTFGFIAFLGCGTLLLL